VGDQAIAARDIGAHPLGHLAPDLLPHPIHARDVEADAIAPAEHEGAELGGMVHHREAPRLRAKSRRSMRPGPPGTDPALQHGGDVQRLRAWDPAAKTSAGAARRLRGCRSSPSLPGDLPPIRDRRARHSGRPLPQRGRGGEVERRSWRSPTSASAGDQLGLRQGRTGAARGRPCSTAGDPAQADARRSPSRTEPNPAGITCRSSYSSGLERDQVPPFRRADPLAHVVAITGVHFDTMRWRLPGGARADG
jgi:hypothetical protein